MFGVWHGPPNALDAPKPTSSIRMINTFSASAGSRSGTIGGYFVSGSLASYVVRLTAATSGIGRTDRDSDVSTRTRQPPRNARPSDGSPAHPTPVAGRIGGDAKVQRVRYHAARAPGARRKCAERGQLHATSLPPSIRDRASTGTCPRGRSAVLAHY